MVTVKILVEGGKAGARADSEFRENWQRFIKSVLPGHRSPRIVVAGSRQDTYKKFKSMYLRPGQFIVLLLDSEDAIGRGTRVWEHLANRQDDNMPQPEGADDTQAHLMVRSMECWFLADRDALRDYYKNNFNENALPKNLKIEEIDRHEATACLNKSAKNTTKGGYHKSRDGFKLIGLIDGNKVRKLSEYADNFFRILEQQLMPSS